MSTFSKKKVLEHPHYSHSARNTQEKMPGHNQDKTTLDSENPVEGDNEDLAGRVCYEFEPLVLS